MPDPSFYAQQAAQQASRQAQQQAQQAHQQAVRAHQQAVRDAAQQRGHRPPSTPVRAGHRGRGGGLVPFLLLVVVAVVLARDAALRHSVLGSLEHLLTKVLHR
ncbi:hypothetical protein [Streptomyces spinosirectus]